jgi:hypothetical protein
MPRIPLADIPNAPAPVQQGPGNIGSLGQVNLAPLGRQYQRSLLQQGSFDGPAKGLQALGQAGGEIAGMLGKIAQAKAEAEADTAAIEAGNRMQVEFADYTSRLTPSTPTDEFVSGWQSRFSQVKQEVLGDQKLSPLARQKIERSALKLEGESIANLTTAANREVFKRSMNAHEQILEQKKSRGDWAGAGEVVAELDRKGLISRDTANAMAEGIASESELYMAKNAIEGDPILALSSLNDPTQFTRLTIRNREQLKDEAGRSINRRKADLLERIRLSFENNQFDSLEDAERLSGSYWDDKLKAETQVLFSRKMGPNEDLKNELDAGIDDYEPTSDPDGKKRYEIERKVKAFVPDGFKQGFLDRISRKAGPRTPSSQVESLARDVLKAARDSGQFGELHEDFFKGNKEMPGETVLDFWISEWGKTKSEQWKAKRDERDETLKRYNQASDSIDRFLREHPTSKRTDAVLEANKILGIFGAEKFGRETFTSPTKTQSGTMNKVKGLFGGTPKPSDVYSPLPANKGSSPVSPGSLTGPMESPKKDR